jgi:hypothetical protein
MNSHVARQAAWELCAGDKLAVPDTTADVVVASRAPDVVFVWAFARKRSAAVEMRLVMKRILCVLM